MMNLKMKLLFGHYLKINIPWCDGYSQQWVLFNEQFSINVEMELWCKVNETGLILTATSSLCLSQVRCKQKLISEQQIKGFFSVSNVFTQHALFGGIFCASMQGLSFTLLHRKSPSRKRLIVDICTRTSRYLVIACPLVSRDLISPLCNDKRCSCSRRGWNVMPQYQRARTKSAEVFQQALLALTYKSILHSCFYFDIFNYLVKSRNLNEHVFLLVALMGS